MNFHSRFCVNSLKMVSLHYSLCKLLRSGVPQLTEVPPKADRGDPVVVARTGVQKMEEYDEDVKTIGKGSNLYYLNYLIRFIYAYKI